MVEIVNKPLAGLIGLLPVLYVSMVIFNGLGGAGYRGLFTQSVGQVSGKYPVFITPAVWTFAIWSFIYIYLGAAVVYCVSTVFRSSNQAGRGGGPVYVSPAILSPLFYVLVAFNFVLNTVWIFLWNNELVTASAIFLLFITYTGWIAVSSAVHGARHALVDDGTLKRLPYREVRLQRAFVHNGLSVYVTWTTIASLLNLNTAFQYFGRYDAELTSLVCCIALLVILIIWFALENTILEPYVGYTVSQYPVVLFALSGILDNQRTKAIPHSVSVMTWILLAVTLILIIARAAIVLYRYRSRIASVSISQQNAKPKNHGIYIKAIKT